MGEATAAQVDNLVAATLSQLVVIVLLARAFNLALRRLGQPGAVGEILAGLALGPSLLGSAFPDATHWLFQGQSSGSIQVISQIGLILLMFQIGCEFHFGHLQRREHRRAVVAVASASLIAPLLLGWLLGCLSSPYLAPGVDATAYRLFFAIALAITAVPILGRILIEFDLSRTPVGVIAITAAAVNDVVGWILLAAISALATANFSWLRTGLQLGGIAAFCAVLWVPLGPVPAWLLQRFPLRNGQIDGSLMAVVLAALFAAAFCTHELGIFPIFGGFALGLLFHRQRSFVEAWQRQIGQFVRIFFLPVFFTYTGLRTDVLGLVEPSEWLWCLLIVAVACAGKIVPVYFSGRCAGLDRTDSSVCGVLMNTRALMELVVLNIGLNLGFIPPKVFTMLVIMAVASTVATVPLLQFALRRQGRALVAVSEA